MTVCGYRNHVTPHTDGKDKTRISSDGRNRYFIVKYRVPSP